MLHEPARPFNIHNRLHIFAIIVVHNIHACIDGVVTCTWLGYMYNECDVICLCYPMKDTLHKKSLNIFLITYM